MNFSEYIYEWLERIDFTNQKIYFFKGFSFEFYNQLMKIKEIPRFSNEDIESVFSKDFDVRRLITSLIMYNQNVSWGTYEELLAISKSINDITTIFKGKIEVIDNNIYKGFYESYSTNIYKEMNSNPKSELDETIYDNYYSDFNLIESGILVEYILKHGESELGLPIPESQFYKIDYIENNYQSEIASKITENELNKIVFECLNEKYHGIDFSLNILPSKEKILLDRLSVLNTIFKSKSIRFLAGKSNKNTIRSNIDHLKYFKRHWGNDKGYRNGLYYKDPDLSLETIEINQGEIIDDILTQCDLSRNEKDGIFKSSDIIVTAPTGAGKSLLFQIPGIILHNKYSEITVVVTPLQALMKDQVEKLNFERKIEYATFINSEISFDERRQRIEGIKKGEYSIVYLSPELLLSTMIEDLIGGRRIGLLVVDEAHLVTSWGRDFRVDYWFLGDYIDKLRNGGYYIKSEKRKFPVLILTATAIYGGEDDEIGELIESLHLNVDQTEHMYLGYSRKENIFFDITPHTAGRSEKDQKNEFVLARISEFVKERNKTIIYCPYTSQVDNIYNLFFAKDEHLASYVGKYHGKLTPFEKEETYRKFKNNQIVVMIATKAFGMGIDIDDIVNVYHFAPTGTLADYVQEIGRAARQLDKGYALMDFIKGKDMRFAKTLWGLGGIKQYQVKEIANVLYKTYKKKKKRNLLISPESFSHIFDSNEVDSKVKSGLMLLTNDLLSKFHFKVITIRPKAMYTTQFVCINETIKNDFIGQYGEYVKEIIANKSRKESGYGTVTDVKITLIGEIYEIDLGRLWEEKFYNLTFPQFKYKFFNNELFNFSERIIPKMKLVVDYSELGYENVQNEFLNIAEKIHNTFLEISRQYNKTEFNFNTFYTKFSSFFEEKNKPKQEFVRLLFDMFCLDGISLDSNTKSQWKFIQKIKRENSPEASYKLVTNKHNYVYSNLKRYIGDSKPNNPKDENIVFINIPDKGKENTEFRILIASILQLFNLASFEIQGGKNAQIFVRINDPLKLDQIINSKSYTNNILQGITRKHEKAITFMNQFLGGNFINTERWDIIENFFLGRNELVNYMLSSKVKLMEPSQNEIKMKIIDMGEKTKDYYSSWNELQENSIFEKLSIPLPDYLATEIMIDNENYVIEYYWKDLNIGILSSMKKLVSSKEKEVSINLLNFEDINSSTIMNLFGERVEVGSTNS